jgi:hypothetical protein
MNDMRAVIVPKSDQINADNLLAGPMTIRIRAVTIRPGTEQPVSVFFDGDDDKPYKPCKSMARVMVQCWGDDANAYVGRSMTLYCDPKVTWGGIAVGGIRISHMSDIDRPITMALTATKAQRRPFTVNPLRLALAAPAPDKLLTDAREAAAKGTAAYSEFWRLLTNPARATLRDEHPKLKRIAEEADKSLPPVDGFEEGLNA